MEVPSLLAPVDDVLLGSLEADRKTNRSTALERAGREATEIERRRWLSSLLRPSAILPSSRHRETARLLLLLRLRGGSRRLGAFLEPFRSQTVAITSCATMYRRAVRFTRGHDAHVKVVQAAMISCAARPHPSLSSPSSSPPPHPDCPYHRWSLLTHFSPLSTVGIDNQSLGAISSRFLAVAPRISRIIVERASPPVTVSEISEICLPIRSAAIIPIPSTVAAKTWAGLNYTECLWGEFHLPGNFGNSRPCRCLTTSFFRRLSGYATHCQSRIIPIKGIRRGFCWRRHGANSYSAPCKQPSLCLYR